MTLPVRHLHAHIQIHTHRDTHTHTPRSPFCFHTHCPLIPAPLPSPSQDPYPVPRIPLQGKTDSLCSARHVNSQHGTWVAGSTATSPPLSAALCFNLPSSAGSARTHKPIIVSRRSEILLPCPPPEPGPPSLCGQLLQREVNTTVAPLQPLPPGLP